MVAMLLFSIKSRTSVLNTIDMAEADKLTELNGLGPGFHKKVTRMQHSKGTGTSLKGPASGS